MKKARYKLVYNPAALYAYQLYKRTWIFWTVVCRSNCKVTIAEYLRLAGQTEIQYFNGKGQVIEYGIENSRILS